MNKVFFFLSLVLLVSCAEKKKTDSKKFTLGEMKGLVYTNSYFGLELKVPANWYLVDKDGKARIAESLVETLKENNPGKEKEFNAAKDNFGYLLILNKYQVDTNLAVNPKLAFSAQNVTSSQRLQDPATAIRTGYTEMKKMGYPLIFDQVIADRKLDKTVFKHANFTMDLDSIKVQLAMYVANFGNYNLTIALTSQTNEQKDELDAILKDIRFR